MGTPLLFFSLLTFSLLPFSTAVPPTTFLSASEILSNSGFVSMALTLELVSQTLIPHSSSATIFSPSDAAFNISGQPNLSLLKFHVSPLAFSLQSLRSLPYGSRIPTLDSGHSLIITTLGSDSPVSINNVTVEGSPVYDDGSLIVFGISDFFDPDFGGTVQVKSVVPDLGCAVAPTDPAGMYGVSSFFEASGFLKSSGYTMIASFLDLQLLGFAYQPTLTVFAPVDEVMKLSTGNYSDFPALFLRHVVTCKLSWTDLAGFSNGTVLRTPLQGFTINVTRSGEILMLNEVPLNFPDLYTNDWLVVHGLREVLSIPQNPDEDSVSSPETEGRSEETLTDRIEF